MRLSTVLANTAVLAASMVVSVELDPIVMKEFSGKGTGSGSGLKHKDNLADVEGCKRDMPLLKELKTNTIRVYQIDPEADHKECMELLDDAGIYVVADLSEPVDSINRDDPEWNHDL
ncbi:1,3-beta-glucanosyltransferase gas1 [Emmonsiellopsis sp. PD_33]|nr:1,3-beta-glucanosyltransferase gas1 [Emmonsiellopsis sp. PD_33]